MNQLLKSKIQKPAKAQLLKFWGLKKVQESASLISWGWFRNRKSTITISLHATDRWMANKAFSTVLLLTDCTHGLKIEQSCFFKSSIVVDSIHTNERQSQSTYLCVFTNKDGQKTAHTKPDLKKTIPSEWYRIHNTFVCNASNALQAHVEHFLASIFQTTLSVLMRPE